MMIKTIAEAAEYLSAYLLIDDIPDGDSSPEFRVSMLRNCQIKPLGAKLLSLVADGQLTARTPTGTSCTSEVEPTESTLIDVAEAKAALDADAPFGKLFEDDRASLPGADSPISLSARIGNSDAGWPTNAEFAEYVSNGAFINWPYWVGKMPILNPQQAARLMAGLDPDIFESLDAQPNRNDATQRCTHAKYIERLAIAEQITKLTPSEWLQWADKHEFEVHDAFRGAVQPSDATNDSQAKSSELENNISAPLQRQRFQEQEIIRALNEFGYDPQAIPKWKAGERGVKSTIREALKTNNWSDKVFDKAWQRLRDNGEIAES